MKTRAMRWTMIVAMGGVVLQATTSCATQAFETIVQLGLSVAIDTLLSQLLATTAT
ncbi:MAG: hypothetical protein JXA69_06080 [Phycisphaerae bacterium]|nr:hypothetical protein [Phycisphaerae bacterium]